MAAVTGELYFPQQRLYTYCFVAVDTIRRACDAALDEGKYQFSCPSCDLELTFDVVRHILSSVMSDQDLTAMLDRMNKNFLNKSDTNIRSCQVCGVNWKRDYTKSWPGHQNRIVCNTCSRNKGKTVEYCWVCGREWGRYSDKCGHPDCTWEQDQITMLKNCGTKTIGSVKDCPIIRACPRCGTLIHHKDGCKHMTCKCGCKFCFVCLKKKENIIWECEPYDNNCPTAPRQSALPSPEDRPTPNTPTPRPTSDTSGGGCVIL